MPRLMDEDTFKSRLRAILGAPVLSLTVLDPRTEEPYQQLCELFMESNEEQRAHIRAGWPYGIEWRIPVPGTTYDWRGRGVCPRRGRASPTEQPLHTTASDARVR